MDARRKTDAENSAASRNNIPDAGDYNQPQTAIKRLCGGYLPHCDLSGERRAGTA